MNKKYHNHYSNSYKWTVKMALWVAAVVIVIGLILTVLEALGIIEPDFLKRVLPQ